MSNPVLNRTFEQSQQKNAHRLTLIALADRANDEGLCDPGFEDIAKRVGVGERQAKRLVAQLEESGELYIGHGGGRCSTNLYFITVGLSLEQIEATLKKHFNLGDRTTTTAKAVYAKIEGAGLYIPKYQPKGVTRGNNGVTDDTLSHSQNGDTQGIDVPLNGVTDDTVYTNGDENGVIQGQETVSSIPPEPINNLLIDSPIESTKPQQPESRMHAKAAAVVVPEYIPDEPNFPPDTKRDTENKVIDLYKSAYNLLIISPMMIGILRKDALKYPFEWIEQAAEITVTAGKDWRFAQGILKNWHKIGGPENDIKPERKIFNGRTDKAGPYPAKRSSKTAAVPSPQWPIEPDRSYLDEYIVPPAVSAD